MFEKIKNFFRSKKVRTPFDIKNGDYFIAKDRFDPSVYYVGVVERTWWSDDFENRHNIILLGFDIEVTQFGVRESSINFNFNHISSKSILMKLD